MSGRATYADWIAVDWGTSNLRVWAMTGADDVVASANSGDGMGQLAPEGFEPALLKLIEPWLGAGAMPVIVCGMAGSRQGWAEAPYRAVPGAPVGPAVPVAANDRRMDVHILPGLKQLDPPDVMRGEETQIAGFLAARPGFDGIVCLPGTHTKWVHVSAGEIVSFQTFMTGEMYDLLARKSVLRHSLDAGGEWDRATFLDTVADTLTSRDGMAAQLFRIRAADLLHGLAPDICRARLSGALIGAELVAARAYWLGQRIALVGAPGLTALYSAALEAQGVEVTSLAGDDMALQGLVAARCGVVG